MTAPLRLLQITDFHLKAAADARLLGVDTAATLAAVLDQALAEATPDAVLATGDLAHDPEPAAYQRVARIVGERFHGPVLYLAGNHDLSAPLAATLGSDDSLTLGEWTVLAFDSHVDHRTGAGLDDHARRRLEQRIGAAGSRHVLLACHHPPLPVGCPWLDKDCIPGGRELLESCAASAGSGRVRGLVCGHVHQPLEAAHGRIAVLGTPSTCFQFQPGSRRFTIDRDPVSGQPGYRWLELDDDGSLRTGIRRLEGAPLNIDLSEVT